MRFLIAHISNPGSKTNRSYRNWFIEKTKKNESMLWDDNEKNTMKDGDFMLFYCWGERVEIHTVIKRSDATTRPLHWDKNTCQVLHLSPQLHTCSFSTFGKYDPPYAVYKQGCKKKNAYDISGYPKVHSLLKQNPIETTIHPSKLIAEYYKILSRNENDSLCGGSGFTFTEGSFINWCYRTHATDTEHNRLHVNKRNLLDTVPILCESIQKGCVDFKTYYKVCDRVLEDYKQIVLYYCIGVCGGEPEIDTEFNRSRDIHDAICLYCEDDSKACSQYRCPSVWMCKDWEKYGASNSYEFSIR